MKNKYTKLAIVGALVIAVFALGVNLLTNVENSDTVQRQLGYVDDLTNVSEYVHKMARAIPVKNENLGMGNMEGYMMSEHSLANELPNIDTQAKPVVGYGDINITIFSSPEKADKNSASDNWLVEVAERFNKSGATINGKSVSVTVYSVTSGLISDYVVSKKYTPELITPSNDLWTQIISASGVQTKEVRQSLVGNTAGIVIKDAAYNKVEKNYGEVTYKTIIEATRNKEIVFGYTNPFYSSGGLNALVTLLYDAGNGNVLDPYAIHSFEEFQMQVPFVSYNTLQIREAISKNVLDAIVYEYQLFKNTQILQKGYKFVEFGVPHDNPLYAIGNITDEKMQAIELFAKECDSDWAKKLALQKGFTDGSYKYEMEGLNGSILTEAQQVWKEKKDSGRPVITIFIADMSGSMAGGPVVSLKEALVNSVQYIKPTNYIGLISYDDTVRKHLEIDEFGFNQQALFLGAAQGMTTGGSTATYDAVMVGMDMLLAKAKEVPDAKLQVILLTDGEPNSGVYGSLSKIQNAITKSGITIHCIVYNQNVGEMQNMTNMNEGACIKATNEDITHNIKGLFNAQM